VLAGKDAHSARRFRNWPLKGRELRRRHAAIRHRHRSLEIGRSDRLIAARANLLGTVGRIHRGEGDAFDAFAIAEKGPRRCIVSGVSQHAEQLDVIGIKHDGVIARAHMRAMGAARRDGEAEPLPVRGGGVEIPSHDDGMVDSDDIPERHSAVSPASIGL
jgi:hypothetical protein